jgi:archaetidylserine synthase
MARRSDRELTHVSMLNLIKLPDLLSILSALLGFTVLVLVLGAVPVGERTLSHALILILFAAVIDGLDGLVARTFECSPLGTYLDSFADFLSFGIAPAILGYVLARDLFHLAAPQLELVLAVCGAYVICGMLRLARFNAHQVIVAREPAVGEVKPAGYELAFIGFPITGAATLLASLLLVTIELQLSPQTGVPLFLGVLALLCILMPSRIRYRVLRAKRIALPLGFLFLSLFSLYLLSSAFIYPALAVLSLTALYMCTPLLYSKSKE